MASILARVSDHKLATTHIQMHTQQERTELWSLFFDYKMRVFIFLDDCSPCRSRRELAIG